MNYYIVVEGKKTENKIYSKWINQLNPNLSKVESLDEIIDNTYYIVSGGGHPFYYEVIRNAAEDVKINKISCLVIVIDSEELTLEEKLVEIRSLVSDYDGLIRYEIIIQHFCIEAWLLGNQKIVKRNPQCRVLKKYLRNHHVGNEDPELLPHIEEFRTRAQYAEDYLKRLFNEKFHELSYSKSNPRHIIHDTYLPQLIKRNQITGHINSFKMVLDVFGSK